MDFFLVDAKIYHTLHYSPKMILHRIQLSLHNVILISCRQFILGAEGTEAILSTGYRFLWRESIMMALLSDR